MSSILGNLSYAVLDMDTRTFGEWIDDEYRYRRGLKQKQFAELIGVSNKTVSGWVNGVSVPEDESYAKIADALNAVGDFEPVTANEVRERAGRPRVGVELAARLEVRAGIRASVTVGKDPVDVRFMPITDTAAADTLRTSWGPGDLFPVPRRKLQGLSSPILVVAKGDCMEPRDINDGDLVILDTDVEPKLGDIVAVRVGDDTTLKEYSSIEGDVVVLRAAKPGYPPIRIKLSDQGAQLVGVVRGSFSWKTH